MLSLLLTVIGWGQCSRCIGLGWNFAKGLALPDDVASLFSGETFKFVKAAAGLVFRG